MAFGDAQRSGSMATYGGLGLGAAVGSVLAIALLVIFWDRPVNHDIAWFLFATRDWLAGAELYVDLVEVNPPLNFYLTVPALVLADLFGISDTNGQYLAVALLLFASLLWSGAILGSAFDFTYPRQALLLLGIGMAVVLPSLNGVGQREQVMVLCFMPWALRVASPLGASTGELVRSAGFAAIGMCLKPYFVLFPLAVTLLDCLQSRSLRPVFSPSNLVFLVAGLAYLAFVRVVHPAYLSDIVGFGLEVYGAYGKSFADTLSGIRAAPGLLLLLVAVSLRGQAMTRQASVFAVLSIAGLLTYLLQGTGFSYHKAPFSAFGMIMALFILIQATHLTAPAVLAAGVLAFLTNGGIQQGFYRNEAVPEIMRTTRGMGPFNGVMTISSHVYTGPPVAIALGTDWVSSYPANWLVPDAINRLSRMDCSSHADTCDRLRDIAARNRSDNIADIARARPDLLIVDRNSGYFDRPGFDWLGFMAKDPGWEKVFADYRQVASSERFLYFRRQP